MPPPPLVHALASHEQACPFCALIAQLAPSLPSGSHVTGLPRLCAHCPALVCPLLLRFQAKGLFTDRVAWVGEDYIRLEDGGNTCVTRQCARCVKSGKAATQYLVGTRTEKPHYY